jgi:hypothetical protein
MVIFNSYVKLPEGIYYRRLRVGWNPMGLPDFGSAATKRKLISAAKKKQPVFDEIDG